MSKRTAGRDMSRRSFVRIAAVGTPIAVAGIGAIAWYVQPSASGSGSLPLPAAGGAWQRRETRPTLDPARFVGKPAEAHRVARAMPDTLDQLYCYCECDKSIGHKSLLSCYTDGHAAT